jgi:glucan phosphoethanolaminetransferase (alkaline phosphatase superfamily)
LIWLRKLTLLLLWLLFVALWYRVFGITTLQDVKDAATYLGGITVVYTILVTVWILHNLAIYRRKGPRRGVPFLNFASIHDRLGSYIVAPTDIKEKQAITVTVADGRKVFTERTAAPQ